MNIRFLYKILCISIFFSLYNLNHAGATAARAARQSLRNTANTLGQIVKQAPKPGLGQPLGTTLKPQTAPHHIPSAKPNAIPKSNSHALRFGRDGLLDAGNKALKAKTAYDENKSKETDHQQTKKPITESPKELLKRVEKEHQTRPESPTRKTEQQLEATEETPDSSVVANHELALQPQETAQTARFFEDFRAFEDLFGLRGQAQQPHIPQAAPFYRIPNPDLYEEQEFIELDPFPQPSQPLSFIEQTRNPEASIDAIPLPITPAFSDHDIAAFVQPQQEIIFLEPQTLEGNVKPIAELFTAITETFTEEEAKKIIQTFNNETIIGLRIDGTTIAVATRNRATDTPSVFTIDTSRLRQPTHSAADTLPGLPSKPALPAPSTPPIRPIAPAIEQPALPRTIPLTPTLPAAPEASLPPLQVPEIAPESFIDIPFSDAPHVDHDILPDIVPSADRTNPQTLDKYAKPITTLLTAITETFTEEEAKELAKIFKNETIVGLQINGPTIAVATQNRTTGTPSVFTIDTSLLRQQTSKGLDTLPGVQSKPALPTLSTPPIRPIAPAIEQPALPNRAMPLTPTLPAAPEASLPPLQAPEIAPTDFVDELFDLPLLDIPAPDHDTLPIVLPTEEPMPFIRQAITPPLPARTAPASARTIADPRRIMPRRMPTTIPRPLPIAIPRRMPARRAAPPAPALIAPEEPLEEDIAILPIELPKLNNPIKTIKQRLSDDNNAIHQSDQPYKYALSHDNSNQYSSLMPSEPVTKTPGNHAAHSISSSPTYQRPSASTFNAPYASASQPTKQSSPTEQNLDKTVTNKVVVINNYRPENAAAKPNDSKPFIKAESAPAQTHDISGYGFSY